MEGGVDVEDSIPQDAPQDIEKDEHGTGAETTEDNKFQTAIGSWRSRTGFIRAMPSC